MPDSVIIDYVNTLENIALDIRLSNGHTIIVEIVPQVTRNPRFAWIEREFPRPKTDGSYVYWEDGLHDVKLSLSELFALLLNSPNDSGDTTPILKINKATMHDDETLDIDLSNHNQILFYVDNSKSRTMIEPATDTTEIYWSDGSVLTLTEIMMALGLPWETWRTQKELAETAGVLGCESKDLMEGEQHNAVNKMRTAAQSNGTALLSDEDIKAEIDVVRKERKG